MSKEFSLPLRVYIEDTDAGGVVYYVNYLKFMERARTEFMRSLGFDKRFVFNNNLMFVVKDVQINYLQPGQLDDQLSVTAVVTRLGGANMVMSQSVWRDNVVLARAEIKIVSVNRHSLKPMRLPPEIISAVREQLSEQGVAS